MAYPASIDSFTTQTTSDYALPAIINAVQTAVAAIETELGTDPAGSETDVKTRLAVSLDDDGNLHFPTPTVLTLSGGSATPVANFHAFTTEAGATTDDLDTLTDVADGFWFIAHVVADNRQVRIRSGIDNILCPNGQDIKLRRAGDLVLFVEDDALGYWLAISFSPAGLVRPSTALTANATLTSAHQVLLCDATAGAFTVTLPAVATSVDWEYTLIKVDDSANAVTVDGASAETINGAATYALSTQFAKATIHCTGTEWLVTG